MAHLEDTTASLTGAGREIYAAIVAKRAAQGTDVRGPYLALLNHPVLTKYIEALGYYLKFESVLPRNIYQFVVLAFARHVDDAFIWSDHIEAARAAGVPDEIVTALDDSPNRDAAALAEPYSSVATVIDVAMSFASIPEELQTSVVDMFGIEGLIEIVTLCGFYQILTLVNHSFDVAIPDAGS